MATPTPNYGFILPEEGADTDLWGGLLNMNWDALDTILQSVQQQITDAIEAARIKVGDLYFSADADDPATKLGYGVWVAHAAGRAIVGVGNNGESEWEVDQERGAENHLLTAGEMPSHTHGPGNLQGTTTSAGEHEHTMRMLMGSAESGNLDGIRVAQSSVLENPTSRAQANLGGIHQHSVQMTAGFTAIEGGSGSHNNVQPSIGVYVWKRTE